MPDGMTLAEKPTHTATRKRPPSLAAITCLALLLLAAPVAAKSGEDLRKIEQELARQKEQAARLAESENATVRDLDGLQQKLVAATAALQAKQREQETLEDQLAKLEADSAARSAALESGRQRLTELTAALLRLSRLPPEAFLLHEEQTADHAHRAMLLRAILPQLRAETEAAAQGLDALETLRRATAEQKQLLDATRQNLEAQRVNLDAMVRTRQGLLQNTAAQRDAMAAQMAQLTADAQTLRQLLDKVSQPVLPKGPPMRLQAGLKPPVAGRLLRDYGMKDGYGVASEGLTFAAASESLVIAPHDGKIVFAGPFRGYGKIVIIDHGGGNHSFLAGFGRIDAEVGQTVKAGEPLGQLPDSATKPPELYFEWRHDGEPADPTVAIKERR